MNQRADTSNDDAPVEEGLRDKNGGVQRFAEKLQKRLRISNTTYNTAAFQKKSTKALSLDTRV